MSKKLRTRVWKDTPDPLVDLQVDGVFVHNAGIYAVPNSRGSVLENDLLVINDDGTVVLLEPQDITEEAQS